MDTVRVVFEPGDRTVEVPVGATLLDAARLAGVAIDAPCDGRGRCGRCVVRVDGAVAAPTSDELALLGQRSLADGVRLACRVRIIGDAHVRVGVAGGVRVVSESTLEPAWPVDPLEPGEEARAAQRPFGAAVDVGTTTVAVSLVDRRNGDEVARTGMLNAQYPWGADVMSRVSAGVREGTDVLRRALVHQVERLIVGTLEPRGLAPADVGRITLVGNAVMMNVLLGCDVTPFAGAPYEGAMLDAVTTTGRELGMHELGDAACFVLPSASAFIGADVVAGLVATRAHEREGRALFLDLGTNGEIVLAGSDGLLAASAAAGPALEGGGIASGMRAAPGAVERVWREGDDIAFATIGGVPPLGICGSGLLDLLAVLLDAGVLDASGRLVTDVPGAVGGRVRERDDGRVFVVDEAADVVLTQRDVRALQLAKGAVRAALEVLLAVAEVQPGGVAEVVIAGGFGLHVDARALVRIGALPDGWQDRVRFVGNTALAGARAALVSREAWREAERVARLVRTVPLAGDPRFEERFIAALDFPVA